ncbi:hypothetical protein JXA59_00765 [Patescibacteria group bacterium]|nr:hypothetical protein [Patescibacteria group bacterium]
MMPGHPRYQPKTLIPYFGYDNYAHWLLVIEIAIFRIACRMGLFTAQQGQLQLLSSKVEQQLLNNVTTTEMDRLEFGDEDAGIKGTHHDIEALKRASERYLPRALWSLFHFGATSWDIVATAISLMLLLSYRAVIRPLIIKWGNSLADRTEHYAETVMLGRTHGQPANPITVGHWLAYPLGRLIDILAHLDQFASELTGKYSGPVGASNALVAFGRGDARAIEEELLRELGLAQPLVSTQITPPESWSRYLHELVQLTGVMAQLAIDVRLLYIPEIGEVGVATLGFDPATTTGSSTMSHKRNPIDPENVCGMHIIANSQLNLVGSLATSWLQRDLVGSSVSRYLPIIPICATYALQKILKVTGALDINAQRARQNLTDQGDLILSELLQLALKHYGYSGNAHQLVNKLVSEAQKTGVSLMETTERILRENKADLLGPNLELSDLEIPWLRLISDEDGLGLNSLMREPRRYIGLSAQNAHRVAQLWREQTAV